MTVINESGLYSVILRSDKPEAKAFKRWVTNEVLPSIRRTGRYELGGQTAPMALQGPGAAPLPLSAQSLWFTLLWLCLYQLAKLLVFIVTVTLCFGKGRLCADDLLLGKINSEMDGVFAVTHNVLPFCAHALSGRSLPCFERCFPHVLDTV